MANKDLTKNADQLLIENEELRSRLAEAEEALNAIRNGEVDAIVVSGKEGDKIFSLSGAETPYRLLLEEMEEGAVTLYANGTIQYCNERFAILLSVPKETITGSNIKTYAHEDSKADLLNLIKKASKTRASKVITFFRDGHKSQVNLKISANKLPKEMSGDICIVASDVSTLISYQDKLGVQVKNRTRALNRANLKLEKDLVELRKSKEALQDSKNRLATLYNSMSEGLAIHELIFDESGKPADYRFVDVNPAFEMITRLKKKKTLGRKATEVFSLSEAPFLETYSEVAIKGEEASFETYFPPLRKHFNISAFSPEKGKFVTIFQDITPRKLLEKSTIKQNLILRAINNILEAVLHSSNEEDLGIACLNIAQKITESKFGFIGKINSQGLEEIAISDPGWDACNIPDKRGLRTSEISFKIHGICGRVISDGKSLIANDPAHHQNRIGLPEGHPLLESFMGVPLIRNSKTVGIIALGNRPGGYNNSEQETLEAIASTIVEAFERKRAEVELIKNEILLKSVLDNVNSGVALIDENGSFIVYNPLFLKLFGLSEDVSVKNVNDQNWAEWKVFNIDGTLLDVNDHPVRKATITGKRIDQQLVGVRLPTGGNIIWMLISAEPLYKDNGELEKIICTYHDITEFKRIEENLKTSEEKLKELLATKDKFFNIMAHDLKNPFTCLMGSSELLLENIDKLTPEKVKSLAFLLNDSAKSGFSILQNLLDWSRSQTGLLKIYPEKLNLRKLIAENISNQKLSAKNKGISIIIESERDIYLTTDRNMINTVLRNLLSNSIKFTHKFGEVVISLRKESGNVIILVKDNGVGISPDRIRMLFNLESRNSTPGTENEQGTGLGLKLIKELVEKLGGYVFVESVLGYGSTFCIKLPRKFEYHLLKI